MRLLLLLVIPAMALSGPRSGIEYSSAEIRRLQASDAENPGMLWVDLGAKLFAQQCAMCHASMKGVPARYRNLVDRKVVNLEAKIRHQASFAYESDELLGLTAYVAHQSRGMPVGEHIDERDAQRGKAEYFRRRGQMNLACAH